MRRLLGHQGQTLTRMVGDWNHLEKGEGYYHLDDGSIDVVDDRGVCAAFDEALGHAFEIHQGAYTWSKLNHGELHRAGRLDRSYLLCAQALCHLL